MTWNIVERFLTHLLMGPAAYLLAYFGLRFFVRKRKTWMTEVFGFEAHQSPFIVGIIAILWVPAFEFTNILQGSFIIKSYFDWASWIIAMFLSAWALHRYYWARREDQL